MFGRKPNSVQRCNCARMQKANCIGKHVHDAHGWKPWCGPDTCETHVPVTEESEHLAKTALHIAEALVAELLHRTPDASHAHGVLYEPGGQPTGSRVEWLRFLPRALRKDAMPIIGFRMGPQLPP